jgi:hypothetical protein
MMSLPPKLRPPAALLIALLCLPVMGLAVCEASPGSPLSVLAAFEEAWCESRADLVEATLAADKIALSLSDAGPQDEAYTRTQAAYLIKDALGYRITESFGFVDFHWTENGSVMPYGIARWEYRRAEKGPVRELMLRVTLREEGPDWVVSEIRVLPQR